MIKDILVTLLLIVAGTLASGILALAALLPAITATMPAVLFYRLATDALAWSDLFLVYVWWAAFAGFLLERDAIDSTLPARIVLNGADRE